MATTTRTASSTQVRHLPAVAAAAGTGALVLMLIGTYVNTPYSGRFGADWGLEGDLSELPVLIGFAAVGAAVVFGAVVRPGLRDGVHDQARRAVILAVVGALSLLVFWTGLPVVLAAGATLLAMESRERSGRTTQPAAVALALAVLTASAAIFIAFTG
jgi:hypothetical protein